MGYLARLAQDNLLTLSTLQALIADLAIDMPADVQEFQQVRGALITRWARYCPRCLAEHGRWRLGWELRFADACSSCGRWLLDTCPACGARQTWRRSALESCPLCGESLLAAESREAPDAVVQLSRALESRAVHRRMPTALAVLDGLDVEQVVQVVRLLGAYGSWDGGRVPQKILDSDALENSWTISTVAAEMLCAWPMGFHHLLDQLQRRADTQSAGRMRGAFGGLYAAIYRGFKSPAFGFLRQAFEDFIAVAWSGAIGRRNRNLDEGILKRMTWIPPRAARRLYGVSASELSRMVEGGAVAALTRHSPGGRAFRMVRKQDVERGRRNRADFVTLETAAKRLGLKRQRLSRLLPVLCPEACKDAVQGVPWNIPRSWLDGWEDRLSGYPSISLVDSTAFVTLGERLRFGGPNDEEIGRIVLGLQRDAIAGVGVAGGERLLPCVVLRQEDLCRLLDRDAEGAERTWLRVQDVADILAVKQEVAYHWVRVGLLPSHEALEHGRRVRRINVADLHAFQQRYVLGRDIARGFQTSPREVVRRLHAAGVQPVSGPGVDDGRQVILERADLVGVLTVAMEEVRSETQYPAAVAAGRPFALTRPKKS